MPFFKQRQQRIDNDHGLTFSWRLPLGSPLSFFFALLVTIGLGLGVLFFVRVRVGGHSRTLEKHGSLTLIPATPEWKDAERIAREAGPFPASIDLHQTAIVQDTVNQAVAALDKPGVRYDPAWQDIPLPSWNAEKPRMKLPPVPDLEDVPLPPSPQRRGGQLLCLSPQLTLIPPSGEMPASLRLGERYLLIYNASGIISEVQPTVKTDLPQEAESWLVDSRVSNPAPEGGWLAVEIIP
jgi:hypothetical protein